MTNYYRSFKKNHEKGCSENTKICAHINRDVANISAIKQIIMKTRKMWIHIKIHIVTCEIDPEQGKFNRNEKKILEDILSELYHWMISHSLTLASQLLIY